MGFNTCSRTLIISSCEAVAIRLLACIRVPHICGSYVLADGHRTAAEFKVCPQDGIAIAIAEIRPFQYHNQVRSGTSKIEELATGELRKSTDEDPYYLRASIVRFHGALRA